jgi:Cu(I)/Ag(I) efflux system membrane fusion protein
MTHVPQTDARQSGRSRLFVAAAALAIASGGIGFAAARLLPQRAAPSAEAAGRKILYWYDPMVPGQRFDRPGKSPYMDMQLVAKYADEAGAGEPAGIAVPSSRTQQLGMRLATVSRGPLADSPTVTGTVDFNQRDVAVVQARAGGFVQRVYGRAPGDIVAAGAPLADVLVPEWGGAQTEYLAVRRTGNAALARAARERLLLLGMAPGLVAAVERSGRVRNTISIATPTGGVIKTLGVRAGMTVSAGQTLAEVNGLGTVWLNAALPEAMAGQVKIGERATASFTAFAGEAFTGRVTAILPEADAASRTLTLRIELPNPGLRLKPGMFATVSLGAAGGDALLVPSEAVIRTGRRTLVMVAKDGGRFLPAEVRTGREGGGNTEILAGLATGERVVASGQFLIDSEASLSAIQPRSIAAPVAQPRAAAQPKTYETVGRVEAIERDGITVSHEPVPAIGWPAMTMRFRLADPAIGRGLKRGDRVRFAFDRPPEGPTVRRVTPEAAR